MQFAKFTATSPELKPVQGSKGATKANDTFKSLADFIKTLKAGEGTRISLKDAGLVANNGKPIEPGGRSVSRAIRSGIATHIGGTEHGEYLYPHQRYRRRLGD